jgi:hypothetical protein
MREFGKTPRESTIVRILKAIFRVLFNPNRNSFGSHYDRMQRRRRKTRFDR